MHGVLRPLTSTVDLGANSFGSFEAAPFNSEQVKSINMDHCPLCLYFNLWFCDDGSEEVIFGTCSGDLEYLQQISPWNQLDWDRGQEMQPAPDLGAEKTGYSTEVDVLAVILTKVDNAFSHNASLSWEMQSTQAFRVNCWDRSYMPLCYVPLYCGHLYKQSSSNKPNFFLKRMFFSRW